MKFNTCQIKHLNSGSEEACVILRWNDHDWWAAFWGCHWLRSTIPRLTKFITQIKCVCELRWNEQRNNFNDEICTKICTNMVPAAFEVTKAEFKHSFVASYVDVVSLLDLHCARPGHFVLDSYFRIFCVKRTFWPELKKFAYCAAVNANFSLDEHSCQGQDEQRALSIARCYKK